MINGIAVGNGLSISAYTTPNPYIDLSRPSSGMLRFSSIGFEVYDGSAWQHIPGNYPLLELGADVHELLQWAKIKRDEEYEMRELVGKYPNLSDAYDELLKAKERFKMLSILMLEEKKV